MKGIPRRIYAVLLAAGESSRLPPQKLFLPWKAGTVLEAVVDNLLAARPAGVAVVAGKEFFRVKELLSGRPCRPVFNPDYRRGMGSSLSRGASFWRETADVSPRDGILVALADQPLIPPGIIKQVISRYRTADRGLVVPVFQGRRGHPVILSGKYLPEICALDSDVGARVVLRAHPEDVLKVAVDSEAILRDIDSREDYVDFRRLKRGSVRGGDGTGVLKREESDSP